MHKYVITLTFDTGNLGRETYVYSADTLEVALECLSTFVHDKESQSTATFAAGDLYHAAIMQASEFEGEIGMRAEDAGFDLESHRDDMIPV